MKNWATGLLVILGVLSLSACNSSNEDQKVHDQMTSCYKTIESTGNGQCVIPLYEKIKSFNGQELDVANISNPLSQDEYQAMGMTFALTKNCIDQIDKGVSVESILSSKFCEFLSEESFK
jgi:hypothetical protein